MKPTQPTIVVDDAKAVMMYMSKAIEIEDIRRQILSGTNYREFSSKKKTYDLKKVRK